MFYYTLITLISYTNTGTIIDLILLTLIFSSSSTVIFFAYYPRLKLTIRVPLLNIRSWSTWRPYFKKDGYFSVVIDKIIWK